MGSGASCIFWSINESPAYIAGEQRHIAQVLERRNNTDRRDGCSPAYVAGGEYIPNAFAKAQAHGAGLPAAPAAADTFAPGATAAKTSKETTMQRRKFLQRTAALGAVAAAGGAFPAGAAPDAPNAGAGGVPTITLNDGNAMPLLGFGTSRMTDPRECQRIVEDAIAAGYRLFDTAKNYFNEEYIGNALKTALGGGIRREEFFITSKLWIDDAGESKALAAFEKSLEKLGLEYLDLYLIHQPFGDVYGAWRAMSRLKKEGRIKSIGVSNFYADRVMDFCLNNEIAPAVNQIEFSVLNQRRKERKVMDEFGVVCESWAPFVSGSDIFSNETLKTIAKNHGKSVAQVILRWHMQQRVVTIPKTSKKERMVENLSIFDFTLAPDEMEKIAALDTGKPQFTDHTDPERIKWMHGLGKRRGKF